MIENKELITHLEKIIDYSVSEEFKGYSKFDALNSPIIQNLSFNNKYIRKFFSVGMSRFFLNLRPIFLVPKKINYKGLSLFISSLAIKYRLYKNDSDLALAFVLLKHLISNSRRSDYSGHCWGYPHPWENLSFYLEAYEPNAVVSIFAGNAILDLYDITKSPALLSLAVSVSDYLIKDLNSINVGKDKLCSSYVSGYNYKVININSFISTFFSRIYSINNDEELLSRSKKHMNWVIENQNDDGSWFYDIDNPFKTSHSSKLNKGIDNYHTGFILDCILDYINYTNNRKNYNPYIKGLSFYKANLFTKDYAPKWEADKTYPFDIHSAAQGILTFAKSSEIEISNLEFSNKIASWTLNNMQSNSIFYYQKNKYYTKKYNLLRWCQAWMAYSISVLLDKNIGNKS